MEITKTCSICGYTETFTLDPDAYKAWQGGAYIQDAFPELSADQRELLKTRICGPCFDKLFSEDEEGGD